MSVFEARYPGRCGVCDEAISVGQACTYVEDEVAHTVCPEPPAPAETCPRCWLILATNGACGCDA